MYVPRVSPAPSSLPCFSSLFSVLSWYFFLARSSRLRDTPFNSTPFLHVRSFCLEFMVYMFPLVVGCMSSKPV
ncbi:hypothetical protein B0H11DRAFT_66512 [Mycena galericulata]|nr:hypothetical protein B0H11DRAFT_66512 [Mycena galericulata]